MANLFLTKMSKQFNEKIIILPANGVTITRHRKVKSEPHFIPYKKLPGNES